MTGDPVTPACRCGEQIAEAMRDLLRLAQQPPPPLLTIEQAAERLGVDRSTLARWVSYKKVSHTRLAGGNTIRFTEENLADIIAAGQHRIEPPEDDLAETCARVLRMWEREQAKSAARPTDRAARVDEVEAARRATAARLTRRGWSL